MRRSKSKAASSKKPRRSDKSKRKTFSPTAPVRVEPRQSANDELVVEELRPEWIDWTPPKRKR
jgi:hypothetical protein